MRASTERGRAHARRAVPLVAAFLVATGPAVAGAWTRAPGEGYYKLDGRAVVADAYYGPTGDRVEIPRLGEYTIAFYGEYGLSGRVTVLGYLPYRRLTLNTVRSRQTGRTIVEGDSVDAPGDVELGLRIAIRRDRPTVLAAGVVLGVPTGDDDQPSGLLTGDGESNQVASFQVGHSFGAAPFYVGGEVGVNNRTRGFADEVRLSVEGGFTGGRTTVILRLRAIESLENGDDEVAGGTSGVQANDQEVVAAAAEVGYRLGRSLGFVVGTEAVARGRNTLAAPAFSAGLVWTPGRSG